MKRNRIICDKWLRVLFLSFVLQVGGGAWMVCGQATTDAKPKITLKFSEKHDKCAYRGEDNLC